MVSSLWLAFSGNEVTYLGDAIVEALRIGYVCLISNDCLEHLKDLAKELR